MIIPKNCMHCGNYIESEHRCKKYKIPISNVASCHDWTPMIEHILTADIEFEPYEQYFMTKEDIERKKKDVS